MSTIGIKELLEAGVHFGHQTRRWNPKMKRFIFEARNGIHVIDLSKTVGQIEEACKFLSATAAKGGNILFVGTKKQAQEAVKESAKACGQPFVTERWLGGTLTNFRTIRERLRRLEELEKLAETGSIKNYSKKMESQLAREQKKIHRNLNGLRTMGKLPGAIVVVDTTRELNALLEAKSLGIPTICLIDTDGNPDLADIPIPGNDDSMRSIDIIIRELCAAAQAGRGERANASPEEMGAAAIASGDDAPNSQRPVRRSSRSQFRAEGRSGSASDAPRSEAAPAPGV